MSKKERVSYNSVNTVVISSSRITNNASTRGNAIVQNITYINKFLIESNRVLPFRADSVHF